ncbi:hypothetical protein [Enhygromyxa salina]|uniref:Uncharacterized protein n=1 Tax=Enhygromyxa salina TaxID=215803 RepID=A0A2S9YMX8_9BACT|nr:hypothetical protein [Enhygromyxa salina]PRQ06434.1 hypothetical protein ENSA7_37530 [Enhygromyxa salina]
MTMPGARRIVVDGEAYRWRVSPGAVVIEHAASSRSVIREALERNEAVGPGRVAELVRHARGCGWRPDQPKAHVVPRGDPFADPRGRDDYVWRKTLRRCLGWFEASVGTRVEVGAYWWEGPCSHASAGLGVRLRWGRCRALPEAECWEGVLVVGGNPDSPGSSVTGFPFAGDRLVRADEEVVYSFGLEPQGEGGRYQERGWRFWDGPGEWAGVERVGDLFGMGRCAARARGSKLRLTLDERLLPTPSGRLGVALHSVIDEHGQTHLDPLGAPWLRGPSLFVEDHHAWLDLTNLGSKWSPACCQVVVRVSGLAFGEGEQSVLSEPTRITW